MKLETFFEKFELFAEAPNAVAKMRELVLELAVQGKLVPQDPNDDVVPTIEEFRGALTKLSNALGNRSPKETSEEAESAFNVPDSWRWMALADIGVAQTGTTPSKNDHTAFNGDIPFIKPADILPNLVEYSNESLTREGAESGSRLAPAGSLLMVCIGTIGKCNLINRECAFNQQINSISPVEWVDPRYLLIAVRASYFQEAAWAKSSSTTIAIINKGKWLSIPVPLPPLAEQKRIVQKVDELMALCDRLEQQQKERDEKHAALSRASLTRFREAPTPANLNFLFHKSYNITPADLRKTILTLAIQGLIVPHDAESIDWKTSKLKDLTTKIGSGSTPSGGKESYQENGVPLIRSMNVHFGGFVRHGLAFLNDEQAEKLKNVTVKADDVLLNITGASIGRVTTAPKDMEGARVNQHVCILRPTAEIIPPFLELFLASPVVQNLIDDVQVGATREALTKAMIEQFEIPVPSLAEQKRIVAKVDELMNLVDKLETQLATSRITAEKLLQAVLAEILSYTS